MVDSKNSPVQNVKRCVLSSNCIMYTLVQNQILWNHVMNNRCSKRNQFAPPLLPFPQLVLSVLCIRGLFSHKLIQVRPSPWMFPKEESSGINSMSSYQLNLLHVSISELKERGWYYRSRTFYWYSFRMSVVGILGTKKTVRTLHCRTKPIKLSTSSSSLGITQWNENDSRQMTYTLIGL